ncbi:trypsin domain-containing protein [Ditylenchus destructor]|nr:trypsin domain-containing protein [Ditylenchus destructor]
MGPSILIRGLMPAKKTVVNHGDPAYEGQWPWMATLILRGYPQTSFCSATIISEEYILSAGHCFGKGMKFHSVQVAVGAVDVVAGHPNIVDIADAFLHPKYENTRTTLKNDVLVLKLAKPLVLSNNVQPICLAGKFDGDDVTKPEDESAIVAGWGCKLTDSKPCYS